MLILGTTYIIEVFYETWKQLFLIIVIFKQGKVCVHRHTAISKQKNQSTVLLHNWEKMGQGIDKQVNGKSLSDLSVLIYRILLSKICILESFS